jgi:hypothetical protein
MKQVQKDLNFINISHSHVDKRPACAKFAITTMKPENYI